MLSFWLHEKRQQMHISHVWDSFPNIWGILLMILNQNDTARLQAFTEAWKHGIYIPGMFIIETDDQNIGWVGGEKPGFFVLM